MKFAYFYKQSDGIRCEGVEYARNKEEVFARLRERGIKPIKVEPRSWTHLYARQILWAAFVLLVSIIVGMAYVLMEESRPHALASQRRMADRDATVINGLKVARPRPRRQIGDLRGIVLTKVFGHPSERYLAQFAQPGTRMPRKRRQDTINMLEDDLFDALDDYIVINDGDGSSVVVLKRIVAGLKEEVSMLVSAGKSVSEICEWLEGRQRMEAEYRAQILAGTETDDEKNKRLLAMGFAATSSHNQVKREESE